MRIRVSCHLPAVVLLLMPIIGYASAASMPSAKEKQRILFVGNSYTYFNNLPFIFEQISNASQPHLLETKMVVEGGATLKSLWEHGEALKTIRQGDWTYVVLQEQSTLGPGPSENGIPQINDPATFYDYSRRFDAEIKKVGAHTVFYLTWSRQDSPQNQAKLTSAYTTIARELGGIVVPVGPAWAAATHERPDLVLHQVDKAHPTPAGTYLAACEFYAVLINRTPTRVPARFVGKPVDMEGHIFKAESHGVLSSPSHVELINLPRRDALFLQAIAWKATRTPPLP